MSLPFAAGVSLPFLGEIVALFFLSVVIAYLCYRIRLVPIAGFLITGVIIGPSALGIVTDAALIDTMAEVGVILLLFTIGIEFSLDDLSRMSRSIFGAGGLQVGLTVAGTTGLLAAIGVDWPSGIYTGCLVALSSTAIVLGLLNERNETDSPSGRLSLAILIFQDLAIIAMVLLVPVLAGEGGSPVGVVWALGKAVVLVGMVLVLAYRLVPWLLDKVAQTRRQELFLLAVVAVCFGTAWLTSLADVSLALGAFLAGLVVSESRYSHHALSEMLPLRTVFNAVFFVSVGMLLDLNFLIRNPLLVVAVAVGTLVLKLVLTAGSALVMRFPARVAGMTALGLAQIGEFSFVLERAGREVGLTPAGLGESGAQAFIAVTVLLMLLTPFLMQAAPKAGQLLASTPLGRLGDRRSEAQGEQTADLEDHVILVGYGPAGERLGRVLQNTGIPYVVVELNPQTVKEVEAQGIPILYGDATRPHILELAGIDRAKLCVVVINDRRAVDGILHLAHFLNPTLQVFVRTRFLSDVERLHREGADIVVPEELETTVRLFSHVLGAYMVAPEEVARQISFIRAGDYEVLRGSIQEAHLMVLQGLDEDGLHTRAVAVRPGAPAAGKTLAELALRQRYGLTVLAVRRDGRMTGSPAGDFRVTLGDRLVLVGTADRFAESAPLFRTPTPEDMD